MSAVAADIPIVAEPPTTPIVLVQSKPQPVTCREVELALLDGDRDKAELALRLYRNHITCRKARLEQLSCLRMRLEWQKAEAAILLLNSLLR